MIPKAVTYAIFSAAICISMVAHEWLVAAVLAVITIIILIDEGPMV